MAILWRSLLLLFLAVLPVQALAQGARLTVVELNVENLFDTHHDSLKRDEDFLPEGRYRWTPSRYWRKLNRLGQTIIACGTDTTRWELPDLVALCEVENDTVLHDLTRRSLLRRAGYEYVMTDSPMSVVLMWPCSILPSPFACSILIPCVWLRLGSVFVPPATCSTPVVNWLRATPSMSLWSMHRVVGEGSGPRALTVWPWLTASPRPSIPCRRHILLRGSSSWVTSTTTMTRPPCAFWLRKG